MRAFWILVFCSFFGWALPQVWVPKEVHDFGTIVEGALFCWEFVLGNVGDAELVLGPAAPSCACTFYSLTKDRLTPGETSVVKVCFDSTGYGGKEVLESLSLRTNDPSQPWVRLALRGYVRPAQPYEAPAKALLAALYLLLDVRSPQAYARGHLLGAVNLPYPSLSEFLGALPRGLSIVVYGEEAEAATKMLRSYGFLAHMLIGDPELWTSRFRSLKVGEVPPPAETSEDVPTIAWENLAKLYLLVLDLRPPEKFWEGTFPGAIRVESNDLRSWVKRLPKAEDFGEGVRVQVWVVDEDGSAAGDAARVLREAGVPAVALVGGLENWRARYGQNWLIPPFWTESSAVP